MGRDSSPPARRTIGPAGHLAGKHAPSVAGPMPPASPRDADDGDFDVSGPQPQNSTSKDESEAWAPALPPHLQAGGASPQAAGPTMPSSDGGRKVSGPTMPTARSVGPSMPPKKSLGPTMPPRGYTAPTAPQRGDDSSSDEDDVGPQLPGQATRRADPRVALEQEMKRWGPAKESKDKGDESNREEWMTVLPKEYKLGATDALKARTFLKDGIKDRGDTSVWTDTPGEKRRKAAERAAEEALGIAAVPAPKQGPSRPTKRDAEQALMYDAFQEESRKRSLLETHQQQHKGGKGSSQTAAPMGVHSSQPTPKFGDEGAIGKSFFERQPVTKAEAQKRIQRLNEGGNALTDRFGSSEGRKFL